MSRHVGKPTICKGENKGADQLRGNREADQRLCFRYSDSTIPLLLKSERMCDILGGFMPRFQNTITMSQRLWRWYFMIRAKAQCILNL